MKYKISIIIPVYNTEKYICECLESLINQTYKNIEMIIVDDGSTDNSYNICLDYAKRDKRIKVYSQQNAGVSTARNLGIKKTTGDFITFVDSDDYCDLNYLEKLKNELHSNELVGFGFRKKYLNKENPYVLDSFYCDNKEKMTEYVIINNTFGGFICNKVFSAKIIKQNNILFNTEIHYSEDLEFTLNYLQHCKAIRYIGFAPYVYRMRKSSVSFNYINEKNATILDLRNNLIEKYSDNEKIANNLKFHYLLDYYKFKKIYNPEKVRKDVINHKKEIINNMHLTLKDKIKVYAIYSKPFVYNVCKMFKSKIEKTYP